MVCFSEDWCYIVVDTEAGFATVRDRWDDLMVAEFDSLDEALEFLAES